MYICHYADSGMTVIAEQIVSVTNEEQTTEWQEHGLTLHIPKNSLPAGCSHTNVTIVIAQSDCYNQTKESQHSRHILYGLKCIEREQPKQLILKTSHCAVDSPPSQGEW